MALQDKKYHGTVRSGSEMIESQSGTLGYQVMLECEDGHTSYIIWLTKATRERAEKTFTEALGVDPEKLRNSTYIENQLGTDIAGREVTFIMEEEEYKGKRRLKVAWLFKRSATSGGNPARAAASFFGAAKKTTTIPAPHDEINDEDIPFRSGRNHEQRNDWYENMPPMPSIKKHGRVLSASRHAGRLS